MTSPATTSLPLVGSRLAGTEGAPLLVLGPSLGTSVATLWESVAGPLGETHHVVGWDLPGHGASHDVAAPDGLTIADLAAAVVALVDRVAGPDATFAYAGDSVGGAVGLQLLLDAPDRVTSAAIVCSGAQIGTRESWAERADLVRRAGTSALVESSAQRWFGGDFVATHPDVAGRLLEQLRHVGDAGYAAVCGALATYDVRERLDEIGAPVLPVAGSDDVATPTEGLRLVADRVQQGRLVVLGGVGHLAPAERPDEVVALLREQLGGIRDRHADGMRVRRQVLGEAHVDRAEAGTTDLTRDFQRFITEYAWGSVWTRPGLDRRSRSMITLTALVAGGHHEELALHVRAAVANGLTRDEIGEVLLQSAVYCGVPSANSAFRVAQRVLDELD